MRDKIIQELIQIEEQENVKILYACESGSRAWGFPSKDSDYDVRFIYIHPVEWYLSIAEKRDVIERPINDLLDISGWDIRKALKLFVKSNPSLMEWLQSPILYLERFNAIEEIKQLIPFAFSAHSCMYHYLSMAKSNFDNYLQDDFVKSKKYFYAIRPILACVWIERYRTMPPLELTILVEDLLDDQAFKTELYNLLERKKAGEELDLEPKNTVLHDFLEEKTAYYQDYIQHTVKEYTVEEERLNVVFRKALKEVWSVSR